MGLGVTTAAGGRDAATEAGVTNFGAAVSAAGLDGTGGLGGAEASGLTGAGAEAAGFAQLTVMDHFVQIPGVGREWEDMYEGYTTLGYLAGVTTSTPDDGLSRVEIPR